MRSEALLTSARRSVLPTPDNLTMTRNGRPISASPGRALIPGAPADGSFPTVLDPGPVVTCVIMQSGSRSAADPSSRSPLGSRLLGDESAGEVGDGSPVGVVDERVPVALAFEDGGVAVPLVFLGWERGMPVE